MSVDAMALEGAQQCAVSLDAPVLCHPEENDPVYGHLDGVVKLAAVEIIVGCKVLGEGTPPALYLLEERRVDRLRAPLALSLLGIFLQRTGGDRLLGEDRCYLIPPFRVLIVSDEVQPRRTSTIVFLRSIAAVINGEL